MKITSNTCFNKLKQKYYIKDIDSILIELPEEVTNILSEEIIETKNGITLNCWKEKFENYQPEKNKSLFEDNENHFHLDWLVDLNNEEEAFKLGVKTIFLLSKKFEEKGYRNIEFSYSFHNKEMARQNDIEQKFEISREYFFGDRLSFNRIRISENIRPSLESYKYDAFLIIRI